MITRREVEILKRNPEQFESFLYEEIAYIKKEKNGIYGIYSAIGAPIAGSDSFEIAEAMCKMQGLQGVCIH